MGEWCPYARDVGDTIDCCQQTLEAGGYGECYCNHADPRDWGQCPLFLLGRAEAAEQERDKWRGVAGHLELALRDLGFNVSQSCKEAREVYDAALKEGQDG